MKKLLLFCIFIFTSLITLSQNVNNSISVYVSKYESGWVNGYYEGLVFVVANYSDAQLLLTGIKMYDYNSSVVYYKPDINATYIEPNTSLAFSYQNSTGTKIIMEKAWIIEIMYLNMKTGGGVITKKVMKPANSISTNKPLSDISDNNTNESNNGTMNGHEYVDLGLPSGKLWAKTNYGATTEYAYGIYIDWPNHDIVSSVWGKEWASPTLSDMQELYNNCSFSWGYSGNNVFGCFVKGKNGNSIFLPAAGFKIRGNSQSVGKDIYYWTSTESHESGFATALTGYSESNSFTTNSTYNYSLCTFPIRPVLTIKTEDPTNNNTREYVDLGLPSGLLWATTNIGANRPEEPGSYFSWGETNPKSEYSWATYKYANGSETALTRYCNDPTYGNVDYKEVLEEQDDAATVNWGKPWRTPTLSETQELINYCSWVLTTQNGVSGYKVTGANGNSIFLPAGGVMQYNWSYFTERSVVMSANLFTYCTSASVLNCQDGAPHWWYGWNRCWGYNVRPVTNMDPNRIIKTLMNTPDIIGIYDIRGHKLDEIHKGINIIKYRNGTSKKVMR